MKGLIEVIDRSVSRVPYWLALLRREDPPYGRYRYYEDSPKEWCLYASIEGVAVEGLLGLTDRWTTAQKREVVDLWSQCQQPDGAFRCPCCAEPDADPRQRCADSNADGIAFKVATTMYAFGAAPSYPLPRGQENETEALTADTVEDWLADTFDRFNPYAAGSMVWKACGVRSLRCLWEHRDPMTEPVVAKIMGWLTRNQDPETGLWFHKGDLLNGMNGLLKMRFGTFDLAGIDIPRPEAIVKTILSIQRADGSFGEACADWNAVGLLAEIGRRVPNARQDIIAAYRRVIPVFLSKQRDSGGYCWGAGAEEVPWLKSTFVNLTGLMSIKYFLTGDDAGLCLIFPNRDLRERLLKGRSADGGQS